MKNLYLLFCFIVILACSNTAFAQQRKSMAENFSGVALNGRQFDLESLKGNVVVLTFWSTRCLVCIGEIPKLNQLSNSYKGKNVVFLGLTTDNSTKVEGFLKSKPFNFDIIPNSFGVVLKYADKDKSGNINMRYPAYFLVNQNGEIELKTNGYDQAAVLNAKINRLLVSEQAKVE